MLKEAERTEAVAIPIRRKSHRMSSQPSSIKKTKVAGAALIELQEEAEEEEDRQIALERAVNAKREALRKRRKHFCCFSCDPWWCWYDGPCFPLASMVGRVKAVAAYTRKFRAPVDQLGMFKFATISRWEAWLFLWLFSRIDKDKTGECATLDFLM